MKTRKNSKRTFVAVVITLIILFAAFAPFLFEVSATSPPQWQSQTQSLDSLNPGQGNVLSAQGKSDVGLDMAWLALKNEDGTWKDYNTGTATTGWWDNAWSKRIKLQINNLGQSDSLVDFPMLVVLNPSRISYSGFKSDGSDVRFLDSSGNVLSYQIESWNTAGSSYLWVKVPAIAANSASGYIWLYYDNPTASNVQTPQSTFDSNFVGVWHLSETTGNLKDSTSNGNDGTPNGATYTTASQIDGGYNFDGSNDYIGVPSSTSKNLNLIGGSFIMEAWVKFSTVNNARLISKNIDANNVYQLISDQATSKWGVHVKEGGSDYICSLSSTSVSTGQWYYVSAIIRKIGTDYSASELYINGAKVTISPAPGQIGAAGGTDLLFGMRADAYSTTHLSGIEDEVRLSNVARSASWVKATYLSGCDTMITYGQVENNGFTPERYGSPILLHGTSGNWVTTSFNWNDPSTRANTVVAWKIGYKDTIGAITYTDQKTFIILAPLNALVIVNSQSPNFGDFQTRIYPYIKHFGICMEGCSGYIISEEASEADLFANLRKWQPHVNFEVKQVQTIDEAITSMGTTMPEAKQ